MAGKNEWPKNVADHHINKLKCNCWSSINFIHLNSPCHIEYIKIIQVLFADEILAPDGCCSGVLPESCQCSVQQQSMHRDGLQIVLQLPESPMSRNGSSYRVF